MNSSRQSATELPLIASNEELNLPKNKPQAIFRVILIGIASWAPTYTFTVYTLATVLKAYEEGSLPELLATGFVTPLAFEAIKQWLNHSNVLEQPLKSDPCSTSWQVILNVAWARAAYALFAENTNHKPSALALNLITAGAGIGMKLAYELLYPHIMHTYKLKANSRGGSVSRAEAKDSDVEPNQFDDINVSYSVVFPGNNSMQASAGEANYAIRHLLTSNDTANNTQKPNLLVLKAGDLALLISAVIGMGALLNWLLAPIMAEDIGITRPASMIATALLLNVAIGDFVITHTGWAKFPAKERNSRTLAIHDLYNIATRTASIATAAPLAALSPYQDTGPGGIITYCTLAYGIYEIGGQVFFVNFLESTGLMLSCDNAAELATHYWNNPGSLCADAYSGVSNLFKSSGSRQLSHTSYEADDCPDLDTESVFDNTHLSNPLLPNTIRADV